jgi:hypothetical protein
VLDGPVRLSLLIGPLVGVPVGGDILDSLESVTVTTTSGTTQSGFELVFRLSRRSPLHTLFLLTGGSTVPVLRVVVLLHIGGNAEVLIDGMMTNHEVRSASGPNDTLAIKGTDLSSVMNIIPLDGLPYPAMPPAVRVLLALAKYAALGVIPMVIPSLIEDVPVPIERIPRHQGTDYAYVKSLAENVGYVFYLEPGPLPNTSRAYWGPEIRVGEPQPALNADLDAPHRNVESLSFTFDKDRKELPIVFIQEPLSKAPIGLPIPDVTPLNPPLGLVGPVPTKPQYLDDTANLPPWVAVMRGIAYASKHSDSVFGNGELNVVRYGRTLKARQLVGVRGAGEAFDGLYYVTKVIHTIKRGEYKQSFSLARNGLLSTIPRVPV